MAKKNKRVKVKISHERRVANLSNFLALMAFLLAMILVVIFSLVFMGVLSFETMNLDGVDLDALSQFGGSTSSMMDSLPEGYYDGENTPLFNYQTTYNGSYYFRCQSYGDYKGDGTSRSAPSYDNGGNTYYPLDYSAIRAKESGAQSYSVSISLVSSMNKTALTPQYSIGKGQFRIDGESRYEEEKVNYSVGAVYPSMANDLTALGESSDPIFVSEETEYREWVYGNYLDLDYYLQQELLDFGSQNGIDGNLGQIELIDQITTLIKDTCTYDLKYDLSGCPEGMDKVVYFLTEYHKGICSQFAYATEIMLRAYGIPARYVSGYVDLNADGEVGMLETHAWCESYVDGIGWLIQETSTVDPSTFAGDYSGGNDSEVGNSSSSAPEDVPVAAFAFTSFSLSTDYTQPIYFRYSSYGDYEDGEWGEAPESGLYYNSFSSTLFWNGERQNSLYPEKTIDLSILQMASLEKALIPNYSASMDTDAGAMVEYDAYHPANSATESYSIGPTTYSGGAYSYSGMSYSLDTKMLETHEAYFTNRGYDLEAYREYAENNYLDVDSQYEEEIDSWLAAKELSELGDVDFNDLNTINEAIGDGISSVYYSSNLGDNDPISYVLDYENEEREANFTMLSSAEVLVLRRLGVPARYVSGYLWNANSQNSASESVSGQGGFIIYAADAYAWVEAYLDGVGWIKLDPTGTIYNPDDFDYYYTSPGTGDDNSSASITNLPTRSQSVIYDGESHYIEQRELTHSDYSAIIAEMDTISFELQSEQYMKTEVGVYDQAYTFKATDLDGNDVTDAYDLAKTYHASLSIEQRPLTITIPADGASRGEEITSGELFKNSGYRLVEGHSLEIEWIGEPGDENENLVDLYILDENENDVTHNYSITVVYEGY